MWAVGRVTGGAAGLLEALLAVLGPRGTLVVPIFGALGALTDAVRADPRAARSADSPARIAAIGSHAAELCGLGLDTPTAHGAGTPYTRLGELGGKVAGASLAQKGPYYY